ncbi:ATP-binding protein [Bacillus kwashiorkori]|uniref:ATP-binding protein n=1 Tax=Bacillus kwashiorkori TaxID=1522318 RepID=UPI0007843EF3|nr:AAA family ATPase [Bacillus kwashiorkori]
MNIKEIHIYGYGKFENYHIDNLQPIQVIYGQNEAGKSTIMSFIHSIFFGFPTKQQSEPRYEPKFHSKYGGQLVIETTDFGVVRIERVKGKATGDVTVFLQDGSIGGEELLQEILQHMDRQTYQSIYSFNIHGLQQVQKLKGEDLSRFLFSTSALGSDQIMQTESNITKEMEQLFRPSGTKPLMNIQLEQLRDSDLKFNEAKAKIANYEMLSLKAEKIAKTIKNYETQLAMLEGELTKKQAWNQIYPLVIDKRETEQQIQSLEKVKFPFNGVKRLEQLQSASILIDNQLPALIKQEGNLKTEMEKIYIDRQLNSYADELQLIIDELPYYRKSVEDATTITTKMKQLETELEINRKKLQYSESNESLLQLDLSFAKKDIVKKLEYKKKRLGEQKEDLLAEEQSVQTKLAETEKFIHQLKEQALSEQEKQFLKEMVNEQQEKQIIDNEWRWIKEQLSHLEKSNQKSNLVKHRNIFMLSIALLTVATLALLVMQQWDIATGVVIPLLLMIVIYLFSNKQEKQFQIIYQSLKEKESKLRGKLDKFSRSESKALDAEEKLHKNTTNEKQIELEMIRLHQLEEQFEHIIQQYENWESEWKNNELKLIELGKEYFISEHLATNHLLECFELLESMQKILIQLNQLTDERNAIKGKIEKKEMKLAKLTENIRVTGSTYEERVIFIKQMLVEQMDRHRKREEKQAKWREVQQQITTLEIEKNSIENQMNQLFNEADAENKDLFLQKAEQRNQLEQLKNHLKLLEQQLQRTPYKLNINEDLPYFSEKELQSIEADIGKMKGEIEQLQKDLLSIQHELKIIEESGLYTDLLHQFYEKKYEFNVQAKQWASLSIAKYVLQKSLAKYKTEKMPRVLQRASKYFTLITNGRYSNIFIDSNRDTLYVEQSNGKIYTPEELSQATGEQLYISLRFALANSISETENYPLIIDDGFVHFDQKRLEQTITLLKQLANNQQVLFFTCHSDLVNHFSTAFQLNP